MLGVPQCDPLAGIEWLEQVELDHVYADMPFPDNLNGLANPCAWAALQLQAARVLDVGCTRANSFSTPLTQHQAFAAASGWLVSKGKKIS